MKALSAAELLDAWEACQFLPSPQRSLALLLAALPELPVQELAIESVGRRDGRLLTLREHLFGRQVAALATCRKCGLQVDLAFATTDIRAPEAPPDASALVQIDGYQAVVRPITSYDLMELQPASGSTAQAGLTILLARSVIEASHNGNPVPAAALPPEVATAIARGLGELDPQAEVLLDMVCPDCGTQWQALFDIASFLWTELDAWAHRTFIEVHRLAWTYGWREADILALSPQRRQRYLQMIG